MKKKHVLYTRKAVWLSGLRRLARNEMCIARVCSNHTSVDFFCRALEYFFRVFVVFSEHNNVRVPFF